MYDYFDKYSLKFYVLIIHVISFYSPDQKSMLKTPGSYKEFLGI